MTESCPRCGGIGILFGESPIICSTCNQSGLVHLQFKLREFIKVQTAFYHVSELIECVKNNSIQSEYIVELYELLIKENKDKDWWVVHEEQPAVYFLEEYLLIHNLINRENIPGGPFRPEVNYMSDTETTWKPHRAYKSKAENTTTNANNTPTNTTTFTPPKTHESTNMSTMDKVKAGGLDVAAAMKQGAIQGSIGAANRSLVRQLETRLGDKYPELLLTEPGRKAVETAIPALMIMLCSFDVNNQIPAKDKIHQAASLAITDSSATAVSQVISLVLSELMPILQTYAKAGEAIDSEDNALDLASMMDTVKEQELVLR